VDLADLNKGNGPLRGVGHFPPELHGRRRVGIVGARAALTRSLEVAHSLAGDLVRRDTVIVSGGAIGIDTASHEGALDAGGATISVLGSAIDLPYPERNLGLFRRIATAAAGGAVVSPFPPGTSANHWTFPKRNLIVAQLSQAIVLVEAGLRSGSLYTGRAALKLGIPVLAVPGSAGCELMIDEGACACQSAKDVLDAIAGTLLRRQPTLPLPFLDEPETQATLTTLRRGRKRQTTDEVARGAGLDAKTVLATLTQLELYGLVRRTAAGGYEPTDAAGQ
jgi:DNA processing protein